MNIIYKFLASTIFVLIFLLCMAATALQQLFSFRKPKRANSNLDKFPTFNCKTQVKWIYRITKSLLITTIVFATTRFCHHQTDGFRLAKISNNTFDKSFVLPVDREIEEILNQKFFYLARGKQSFVFVSEDQKYVIKLLNNHYQQRIRSLNFIPSVSFFNQWKKEQIEYNQTKLKATFDSYELAFNELKNQTALVYFHLKKTHDLNKKLTIVDKLGIEHRIDLDSTGFLIQRKATLALSQLKEWIEKGSLENAKTGVENILKLLIARCQKGISDKDPLIRTNLGFFEDRPIFLDVGPFGKDNQLQEYKIYSKEILKISTALKRWLEVNSPELSEHLEEQLKILL